MWLVMATNTKEESVHIKYAASNYMMECVCLCVHTVCVFCPPCYIINESRVFETTGVVFKKRKKNDTRKSKFLNLSSY